jgi:hypothetical protein
MPLRVVDNHQQNLYLELYPGLSLGTFRATIERSILGERQGELVDTKPSIYLIRVYGKLDPAWSAWFDGMSVTQSQEAGGQETLISGPVNDQAQLRGILNKIWDLNLELVSVSRANDR